MPLEWGRESVGYFSKQAANRLLVFVHGFGGGASSTWKGAETALVADPRAATTDIVFFGYRSLRTQPVLSAGILRGFLNIAATGSHQWNTVATKSLGQNVARDYKEILIVAHSLGAPVSRRAIIDAIRGNAAWADRVRLVLFAPAHMGAFLSDLQKELRGSVGTLLGSIVTIAKLQVLSLDGLEPGSTFLTQLLDDSATELANGWEDQIKAKQVIFGYEDRVVKPDRFLEDPAADVWDGYGHCSVCRCPETVPAVASHL